MAQQQYQMPQGPGRPFSPQSSTSDASQNFPLPPNKRQRVSPDPRSQPVSPYAQSPYPNTSSTSSPHFNNISVPPNIYSTPYGNGHTTPTISLPNKGLNYPPYSNSNQVPSQSLNHTQGQIANGNSFSHNFNANNQFQTSPNLPAQGAGMMGPPSKPVDRDMMNDDQMDILANAGVDIRAEENFALNFYSGSINTQPNFSNPGPNAIGHAFTQFTPGDAASFYGAGPANQTGQPTDNVSQDELQKKAAEMAWADASLGLARSRQHELNRPHVNVGTVWRRMERIARENGLVLNTDDGKMPQLKLPSEFPAEVRVQSGVSSQGSTIVTTGNFLPHNTALADQLALLSLATNLRVRTLLEDAVTLARGRRTGSHGNVPLEWADVSAPSHIPSGAVAIPTETPRGGWESAVSPRTNPLKRSFSTSNKLPTPISDGANTPNGAPTYTNHVVNALRIIVDTDREFEEARLLKRQSRLAGDIASRATSATPGTPGPVAPEPAVKPLTKKEREKQDKGKQSLADTHAQANATTNKFLFGTKSKSKYAWMNGGTGTASGTSTPGRLQTQGLQGTPGGLGSGTVEKQMLTSEGSKKWGQYREDRKDQPVLVEMRDLQAALENDGKEVKVLQEVYAWLETPKNRKP